MKRYYLVKVRFDDKRFPFTNVVYEADSPEQAIEKYWSGWGKLDRKKTLKSIEAEYLGISENISRFIERMIGRFYLLLSIPHYFLIMFLMFIESYKKEK